MFNRRLHAATSRFACLVGKPSRERTSVVSAASADCRDGRITLEQHNDAVAQAEAKCRSIVEPAEGSCKEMVDAMVDRRDRTFAAARKARHEAAEDAREAREC